MSIGDQARYLMVSRHCLSGLIRRMKRDGYVTVAASGQGRRSRLVAIELAKYSDIGTSS